MKAVFDSRIVVAATAIDQHVTPEKLPGDDMLFEILRRHIEKWLAERLRQARVSFNTAFGLIVIGTVIVLCGLVFLLCGYTTAGMVSVASGIVSKITSAVLLKFNKDANDRLDKAEGHAIKVYTAKIDSHRKADGQLQKVDKKRQVKAQHKIQ